MRVTINNTITELPENTSILQLIEKQDTEFYFPIVLLNERMVLSVEWGTTALKDGDAVQIHRVVEGG
jgi:thiamine biosynthesis protein ThiS